MKKIFAFAMALVSMAAAMTSCGNDNDMVTELDPANKKESKAVNTEFDGKIYFAASDAQLMYINNVYNVEVGDQTLTVNVEDLKVATDLPLTVQMELKGMTEKPNMYVYTLPAGLKGEVKVCPKWSSKNVEMPEEFDVFLGICSNSHATIQSHIGLFSDHLDSMISNKSDVCIKIATLK